jgi:hypothetical protein
VVVEIVRFGIISVFEQTLVSFTTGFVDGSEFFCIGLGTAVGFEIEEGNIEGSGVNDLFTVGRGSFVGGSDVVYERECIAWSILPHDEVAVSGVVCGKTSALGEEERDEENE